MTLQPGLSNPDSLRLFKAVALFEQTFGKSTCEFDVQATIGALAAVMNLMDHHPDDLIHQVARVYRQTKHSAKVIEVVDQAVLEGIVQKAKNRLIKTEETLVLLIRTYLQRVSSKLSAKEFVEIVKAAIALLDKDQSESRFSLPEGKRLLYVVLQTFGTQLSQPIPSLGEQIPERLIRLIARLANYHKIIFTGGIEATLMALATQALVEKENTSQRFTPEMLHTVLGKSALTIAPEVLTPDDLDDLTSVIFFKLQLQSSSPKATKSDQEIEEQLNQAIIDFKTKHQKTKHQKTKHQSLKSLTQPKWDNDLSVSSPFFTSRNFETARNDFTWLSQNIDDKSSEDEINP
ncbi:MAG: hypothetical protein AAGA83_00630 [Cyanobacteria bacterium P01_F01_bin.116]